MRLRADEAARFREAAEKAKAFRKKHSDKHPKAAEAKRLEARALLNAALMGEDSLGEQAITVAEDARHDTRIGRKERFQLASLREMVRNRKWSADHVKLREERERSAKRLIEEFPEESGGYEALLNEAANHPDAAKGAALAKEVLEGAAPDPVKKAASLIAERYALVGRSLPEIFGETLGQESALAALKERRIVLYTWASWSPGSVARAKMMRDIVAPDVALVGVCLDGDVAAAKSIAAREGFPGEQVYDERGLESPLVHALKLGATLPIYVANKRGEIRSVSATEYNLAATLSWPSL